MRFAFEQIIEFTNELRELVVVLFQLNLLAQPHRAFSFFRCHEGRVRATPMYGISGGFLDFNPGWEVQHFVW